jgi:cytochrome c oxidase accessory protein FixG
MDWVAGRCRHHDMTEIINTIETIDAVPHNSAARRSLYAARVKIHPKRGAGFFRNLKWLVMAITLGIYYITPWLRWDRGEYAPDQAVLIDLANRRFYFFFIEIWPQEFYYVAGLLIMAGIGLFLVTSTIGRAWCGYTCPQTVWTDLFLVVERLVEGDRSARIKLDAAPWSFGKLAKRVIKNLFWLLIAVATGGAWIFYFADAPTLAMQFFTMQAAPVAYITVALLTATTFVLAGYMREQVCTYMCPWPRIQAAMLDEDSLVVTYNDWRGEPRSRHRKKVQAAGEKVGDCVDCNACVAVCPAGIDIRDGQQLECISCALCIDACDNVMDKIGAPRGLISYSTLKTYDAQKAGLTATIGWRSFLRPRTFVYAAVWTAIGLLMLVSLLHRDRLDVTVQSDRNPQYVQLSDGSIRNGYTIKILNMEQRPRSFVLTFDGLPGATMTMAGVDGEPGQAFTVDVEADKLRAIKVFIAISQQSLTGDQTPFTFKVEEQGSDGTPETRSYEANFQSPAKEKSP